MKAMILAAGGGTRLYPLTFTLPKPVVPIMNRPTMEHIIRHIKEHGFTNIMVNLHNLPEHIENYFKDGSEIGVNINYSHENEPLGTAGGVKYVEDFFDDTFMVIGGDDLHDINLSELVNFHKEKKALATIGLSYEKDVHQYGVVVVNEEGRIIEFQEKPSNEEAKSHWVNNGIYIFEPEILRHIPAGTFYDFGSQLFPRLKEQGAPFYGFKCKGYWKDIGNLVEYRNAHFDCLKGKVKVHFPGYELKKGVWLEEGVVMADDVEITPPVLIGKNCKLARGAKITGPVVMGKYNVLDEGVEIKHTVLWNFNHLKKDVKLLDCLMGSECIVEEGRVFERTVLGSGMKSIFEDYFRHPKMEDTGRLKI